jgi:PhnB protein
MAERDLIEQLDQAIGGAASAAGPEVTSLLRVAGFVRELPDQDFRARLKRELLKETMMIAPATTFKREGFRSLTPYLLAPQSARLMDFMKDVFGVTERLKVPRPDGSIMHAEIMLGDSMIEMGENPPDQFAARPTPLHVYIPDVDAAYARALVAGATSLGAPMDHEYGERGASVKDAAGNHWYLATASGPSPVPEGLHSVNIYLSPRGTPSLIDFLTRAFGAEETMRHEIEGTVVHAKVRIGDSILEMGEAHGQYGPMPCAIHLYVPDADATYSQAVAAGATSINAPADTPYGDRYAAVRDPHGNQWFIATWLGQA